MTVIGFRPLREEASSLCLSFPVSPSGSDHMKRQDVSFFARQEMRSLK